ncbi:MAG TPA: hypothetical protein DEQ74_00925 [Wolbachia sp.]|uniref:ankyrin repeat domain-containing protein n=1 Tax=Wolbachia endosymbiont of Pentalonia nigronervosa TaxID=1301914 RepID=UPI000ECA27BD|nr:ankyrin repeat domain-containing protein [Wolbachia endosymbiont of Pentalonia nigronervosa]MBD0391313.1 ankyrin repeat domain-containing protein [Wolbachia endosymbiont of Pentalonia nigronervosa]HCE59387.1 hypothetical protein [Wolbachia sp.]
MCGEKWQKIFDAIRDLSNHDIIDKIKAVLEAEYPNIYIEWEKSDFDINYLFTFLYGYTNDKCTLLHISAYFGLENIINIQLAAKNVDVNAKSQGGNTALHLAAKNGYIKVVKTLLDKGAKVDIVDHNKHTPLHWAAESGNSDVARILLEHGASVNAKNQDGETPLHWAADSNHTEVVKVLLAKGANVNATDIDRETPLHHAAFYDNTDIIKILLAAGANSTLQNIEGETPINLAESDEIKDFFKNAEDELHRMKNSKIGSTYVSFYELLQADKSLLKNYARNINLCIELRKGQYKKDYPIYASMISDQYKIIKRRCLEESARIAIGCFSTHVEKGNGKLVYTVISEEICRLITSYLTDIDLCLARKSVVRDKETCDYIYK